MLQEYIFNHSVFQKADTIWLQQDTMLVEYNVQESTVASGLKLKGQYPLNNLTPPTSISSYLTFFGEVRAILEPVPLCQHRIIT
jgi:hypothetical protein